MLSREALVGLAALGLPLLIAGLYLLRGLRPVQAFFVVLLAVGLGYLTVTGATSDIGAWVLHAIGQGAAMPAAVTAQ